MTGLAKIEFNNDIINKINNDFIVASPFWGSLSGEIFSKVHSLPVTESILTKYLYAHMPLSDVGQYDFDVIAGYAKHGAFLLENSEFLDGVTPEYFLQYVLAYRINSEDITDSRRFFYDLVHDRVAGMSRSEAVLEANNWCYEQATYRSTSIRTISPLTMYKSGFGRCGEESTFLTSVLRSLGIPARQVYVPRWSHSDSNHAWVEVFCEDGWHFTGACEPKPIMDNGWFPYAASRAMVVHSRLFDDAASTREEITETDGLAVLLNESDRYLKGAMLKVNVKDLNGNNVKGASVRFEIINSAEFFPVACLLTDDNGNCSIKLGQGETHIYVTYEGKSAETFADIRMTDHVEIVLGKEVYAKDEWIPYHINAPESLGIAGNEMTEEMDAAQNAKNAIGDQIRNNRIDSYYDAKYAESFKDYEHVYKTLSLSKGNFDEIRSFLDCEYKGYSIKDKDMILEGITEKDCRDIKKEVLADALMAFEYKDLYDTEVFTHFLLSPRIWFETATPFRGYIKENASEYKEVLKNGADELWDKLVNDIRIDPGKEYTTIFSVPEATLKIGSCTRESLGILFCAICRTFGVPARMDMVYGEPQYFNNGEFVYARSEFKPVATLNLIMTDKEEPMYEQSFTIGRRNEEGNYETIGLWDKKFENGKFTAELSKGNYRILTCERTASGSIVGKMLYFDVKEGDEKTFDISCKELKAENFITRKNIPAVTGISNKEAERNLLFFAEPGKEPTEHVFNELLEISRMGGFPECTIHLVLKNEEALKDSTLDKIRSTYNNLEITFMDFDKVIPGLEAATGVTGKNLPFICVTEGNDTSLYCCSGYNVGCVDIFAKIIRG